MDGMRAIAIILVMLFHARFPGMTGGFIGVQMFFVLSGFLITQLLLIEVMKTGQISIANFYWRRLMRLGPALMLMLVAYVFLAPLLWPTAHNHLQQAIVSALYVSDYGVAFWGVPDVLSHTWSLSVEQHFYLLWPLLLGVALRKLKSRELLITLAGAYVLASLWRWASLKYGHSWNHTYYRFDTNLSGLILGTLLSVAMNDSRLAEVIRKVPRWLALFPLTIIFFLKLSWGNEFLLVYGTLTAELATAIVLIFVVPHRGLSYRMLSTSVLVWIGRLSYSLYLWHYPIFRFLRVQYSWEYVVAIGVPLSVAIAAASYYTVERWGRAVPSNRSRDRHRERPRQQ